MKKWIALLLTLVLALGLVACGNETEETPSMPEGFDGVWYNSAGRKLELKSDGTYLLADEVEGGKWEKKSETEGECTDIYGTFSVTYAKDGEGESLIFGPYGTFRRATEEQVARYESALRKPILSASFSQDCVVASWYKNEKTDQRLSAILNNEGLALTVPNTLLFEGTVRFYDEIIVQLTSGMACVIDKETGISLHSGALLSFTDEYVAIYNSNRLENGMEYRYAVVDGKGDLVVDWTPLPRLTKDGKEFDILNGSTVPAKNLLVAKQYGTAYYFFNPLTGKTFRVEIPSLSAVIKTGDELLFQGGNCSLASDWTSPAQPVEYKAFYLSGDGTPIECVAPEMWNATVRDTCFFEFHPTDVENERQLIVRNRETGESFPLNYPINSPFGHDFLTEGNYGCATYRGTAKNGEEGTCAVVFDLQGNILYDSVLVTSYMSDYGVLYLSENGFLASYLDNEEAVVYNEKGEQVFTGPSIPQWFFTKDRYCSEQKVFDKDGRVLIPHITFLPAEMK